MRRAATESQTSRLYAQRRTACKRLRPSTMDRAVPQAPAPITAMSLTPVPPSSAPQRKAVLGSRQQAGDVLMMLGDDEQGRSNSSREDALHGQARLDIKQINDG